MGEVKLISFLLSPFGRKVEIALRAKGIVYQVVEEDLKNKSEILLQANPVYKKIPVLVHKGRSICESRLIVEYIDETWPSVHQFFPQDPHDHYLVRFWADFLDHKIRGNGDCERRVQRDVNEREKLCEIERVSGEGRMKEDVAKELKNWKRFGPCMTSICIARGGRRSEKKTSV